MEPAQTIARTFPGALMTDNEDFEASPAWPHTHTIDVADDKVFLKFDAGLAVIKSVSISGRLQWERRRRPPEFHVVANVKSGEVFQPAAAIADWGSPEGRMTAMIFPPDSRTAHIHMIQLLEKHKKAIRGLKIQQLQPGDGAAAPA